MSWTRIMTMLSLLAALALHAAEFEADSETLLLAHFNEQAVQADHATGISRFAGNGARLIEDGYYGKAIDLRSRGLTPDFMNACSDVTPRYDGWGFHARGNVEPWQGTFECWFRAEAGEGAKRLLFSSNFLNAELARPVMAPGRDDYFLGFGLTLNKFAVKYYFPTVKGNCLNGEIGFKDIPGFARYLEPTDWHHFAMTWDQGALHLYLDGRLLITHSLAGELGLVLLDNPVRYLSMSEIILDELRISRSVRYQGTFEPNWRDGQRPDYAFTGNPDAQPFPHDLIEVPLLVAEEVPTGVQRFDATLGAWSLSFDARTGDLLRLGEGERAGAEAINGLRLYRGLERERLAPLELKGGRVRGGRLRSEQHFEGEIVARHELHDEGGVLYWRIDLTNHGAEEAWLEPLLSLPVVLDEPPVELFDGVEPRQLVDVPRRHDEYMSTLPFVAAASEGGYFGVGIDPNNDLSEIVNEWVPGLGKGQIRQGMRVALAPGESYGYTFVIVAGSGSFKTLDAIDAFHNQFPDLYRLRPDVSIYSYMPLTQYQYADPYPDMKRLGYAGAFWGHGPGHDKGDEYGRTDWWDNPELYGERAYERYTRRVERLWKTVGQLREAITMLHVRSYDQWYPVRRFHTCPDVTPEYIVNQLWPGHIPNSDTLTFGQYYYPTYGWYIVNEYNTPIGAHFRTSTREFIRQTRGTCIGFINDMSHAGSLYRHNDEIAGQTPGRAWARDLGPFVRKALGRRQRYQVLDSFVDNGTRMSFVSDGGAFSHTLCAFSAALAIEGAGLYKDLHGSGGYLGPARFMLGEKPITSMTHLNDDWIGHVLNAEEFTPESLRDYYRYVSRQLTLWCIEQGVTLDPSSYMFGRHAALELAPVMVASTVRGRKVIHAAEVADGLWVRRAGNGFESLLVVGNRQPEARTTDLLVHNRYFDGIPLWAPFHGGSSRMQLAAEQSTVTGVAIDPRDVAAFQAVGFLHDTTGSATMELTGDGIEMRLTIDLRLDGSGYLDLSSFAPIYRMAELQLNGEGISLIPDEPLDLPAGQHRIVIDYRTATLAFTTEEWAQVELLKDGHNNVQLVADKGTRFAYDKENVLGQPHIGFEFGSANFWNDFLDQYDSEDGIHGNMEHAEFVDEPGGFAGWQLVFGEAIMLDQEQVRIDTAARQVIIEGPTQGSMRRGIVMLMRMVDRKYPHVGRFHPFRYRKQAFENGDTAPIDKWMVRAGSREFFHKIADPLFLAKPILKAEYEGLYADGNMDFAGKYAVKSPPFIFEPTYADPFVYSFSGTGWRESREELHRQASPESPVEDENAAATAAEAAAETAKATEAKP